VTLCELFLAVLSPLIILHWAISSCGIELSFPGPLFWWKGSHSFAGE